MLDLSWERTLPLLDAGLPEITDMMACFDKTIHVTDFVTMRIGCMNSNILVQTNRGKFLLRVTDKHSFNNERSVYDLVKDKVRVPALLFHADNELARFFIYQFIDGITLQQRILDDNQCDPSLLKQIAKAAALLHNTPRNETLTLAELDVPPYAAWYKIFLENPTVKRKMGERLLDRTHRLVSDKYSDITAIDKYRSLIHCDFRPANILVDKEDQVWVVDWEGACWGHSLADIGQFFRYRKLFHDTTVTVFEETYNTHTTRKLPDDWFELSRFRDLVNTLQLLSIEQETPMRDADLLRIVEDTLQHWGY